MHQPAPATTRDATPWWLAAAVMFGLALVAYLPAALRAGFVNFDDEFFFGPQNPEFREGLGALLDPSRPIANAWLPVAHVSLWLDWRLADGAPWLPHLTALLLHALAACVLVRCVAALGAGRWLALAVGAVFVVHPALAESVAWVSGRKDVLCGLFVFAALLQTVRQAERPGALRLLGIALLGVLAMYSKATAVVLPLLSLLCCLAVPGTRQRFGAPLVLLLVTVPIAWHHQGIAAAEGTLAAGSAGERLAQVPGAFWHYLATTFWPLRLNVLYPEADTLQRFRDQILPGGVAVALAFAAAVVAWRRPRWRLAAVGGFAFAIALLPFNTAFPASSIAAADRYLYLAVPGAALAVFAVVQRLMPRGLPWLVGALLLPMLWLCGGRAHDFGDSTTLWRRSLEVAPANAVAHLNLVEALRTRDATVGEVRAHLEAALAAARQPIHTLRAYNLLLPLAVREADYAQAAAYARGAVAAATDLRARETQPERRAVATSYLLQFLLASFEPLQKAGDAAGAAAALARARELAPDHADVVAFEQLRALGDELAAHPPAAGATALLPDDDARGAEADRVLAAALQRTPDHPGLLCTQATWDHARGRVLAALRNYRRAQAADSQCVDAWLGAARILRERENYADAEDYARKGLAQRPDPALRQELAMALVGQGRLDDAIQHLEAYLRVRPEDADVARVLANVLIGRAYELMSDSGVDRGKVLGIVERALRWNPNEAKAHLVLGRLAREQRRFAAAVQHFDTAYRLLPDFDDARQLLAESLVDLGYERILQRDDAAAGDAFRRCLDVAPDGFAVEGVRLQLQAIWRRSEQRGIERLQQGDRAGAAADFRRCLQLDPDQHWASWLLASALHDDPAADLAELETLCRQAVAWQQQHDLDRSQQVYLLASTLARRGRLDESQQLAREFLHEAQDATRPAVLAALRRLAGE